MLCLRIGKHETCIDTYLKELALSKYILLNRQKRWKWKFNFYSKDLDPNTQKVKKNAIYYDKTQQMNFQAKPLFQAIKQHLNNS